MLQTQINQRKDIQNLIRIYRRAIANMQMSGRLGQEQYQILEALAENMLYDRDAQSLIDQIREVMELIHGGEEIIKECLLAKEFKTANLIAQGYLEQRGGSTV